MKKVFFVLLLVGGLAFANGAQAQIRFGIPLPFPFLVWSGSRDHKDRAHYRKDDHNSSSYSQPRYYYDKGYHRHYYTDEGH